MTVSMFLGPSHPSQAPSDSTQKIDPFILFCDAMEYDSQLKTSGCYTSIAAYRPGGYRSVLGDQYEGLNEEAIDAMALKLFRLKMVKDRMLRPLLDEPGAAALNHRINQLQCGVFTKVRIVCLAAFYYLQFD